MLPLTCAFCAKNTTYAAEELLGRYFICKQCHWLNLLEVQTRAITREARKSELSRGEERAVTPPQHAQAQHS